MTDIIIRFFRNLVHSFMQSLSGLPWVVVVLLILALILIVLIVILTIRGMRKAASKAPGAVPVDQEEVPSDKLPPFGGWISEFLSRKGFFRVSSLSLSFLKALEFLKQTLDTYNYIANLK